MAYRPYIWRKIIPEKRLEQTRREKVKKELRDKGILPPVEEDMNEEQEIGEISATKIREKWNKVVSYKRHLLKTITWRIVGTIDTMLLGWLVTGNLKLGLAIGGFEVLTKMLLYFLHERVWYKYIKYGLDK